MFDSVRNPLNRFMLTATCPRHSRSLSERESPTDLTGTPELSVAVPTTLEVDNGLNVTEPLTLTYGKRAKCAAVRPALAARSERSAAIRSGRLRVASATSAPSSNSRGSAVSDVSTSPSCDSDTPTCCASRMRAFVMSWAAVSESSSLCSVRT